VGVNVKVYFQLVLVPANIYTLRSFLPAVKTSHDVIQKKAKDYYKA